MIERITIKGNRQNFAAEIGFASYEEALNRANGDEYSVAAVYKQNGRLYYESVSTEKLPFDMTKFYDDDPCYLVFGNAKEYAEYIQMYVIDELKPSDFYDEEDYQDAIQETKEFINEIMNMNIGDDKFFLVNSDDCKDYKIKDMYTMRFDYDNRHYEVAVLIESVRKNITTLEQLAQYINSRDDWDTDVTEIIERNGWEDLTHTMYDVCANDQEKVILDEQGKAKVIELQ